VIWYGSSRFFKSRVCGSNFLLPAEEVKKLRPRIVVKNASHPCRSERLARLPGLGDVLFVFVFVMGQSVSLL
jgi:hypothetical protein